MTTPPAAFTIFDALEIAARAHHGQWDKGRPTLPYLTHPIAVMSRFDDPILQMIAVLHDAVEDTRGKPNQVTFADLRAAGAPERVVRGVESMTHLPGETDEVYWARLARNVDAVEVKDADIDHNTDPARLALLGEGHRARLIAKYTLARAAIHEFY